MYSGVMSNTTLPAIDEVLTAEDVCRDYRIKRGTLGSLICKKAIPFFRLTPRMVRFRRSELERWFAERAGLSPADVRNRAA